VSQRERQINAANLLLRELDSLYSGPKPPEGKYQWKWSEDLWSLVPEYRVSDYEAWDPQPVFVYRCKCGVDRRVHEPHCDGLVQAKVKLQKVSVTEAEFKSFKNVWMLCTWIAPPDLDSWVNQMGTDEDYPKNGRYVPVHRGPHCMVLPPTTDPKEYVRLTQYVVKRMREHAETWREEILKSKQKAERLLIPITDSKGNVLRDADPTSNYHKWRDRIKDKLRRFDPAGTVGYTKEIADGGCNDGAAV